MTSIPIDILRAFVAVVETRGFTRAAEELGRTQPTISLQVKRLEELMEAPVFEKSSRLELTPVGAICFDYGKRLLRLHDDMMHEASRRRSARASLRVGVATEFVQHLAPGLERLRAETNHQSLELLTGASAPLAAAFRESALDLALVVGDAGDASAARWRAPLRWFGAVGAPLPKGAPAPVALPSMDSPIAEAALGALRDKGVKYEVVLTTPDSGALSTFAAADGGFTPVIARLAPKGVKPAADKSLPTLPSVTISLLARSPDLVGAGRRWVADLVETFPLS